MDYLYKLLPVELVSIIEKILHEMYFVDTIKKLNATAIIKSWYTHVYVPYNEVIESGDIDFFINKDYSKELSDVSKGGDIIKMIDKIRSPIANMEKDNKSHCAKYIQNLTKLSMVYQSLK